MFCSQCAHEINDGDIYCPMCAKPIASFNFTGWNAPQVEPIDDGETVTQVRPRTVAVRSNALDWVPLISGGVLALIGIFAIVFAMTRGDAPQTGGLPSANLPTAAPQNSLPIAVPTADVSKAVNQTPVPTRTPINIDAENERNELAETANAADREASRAAINAAMNRPVANREASRAAINAAMNRPVANRRASNTNVMQVPLINGFPAWDKDGKPLRAICNNNRPSYWQYDKWATCGMNGGVKIWVRE